jgi:predicted DNA-binding protein
MKTKQDEQIQTAIRLPKSLLKRLDKLAEHMSRQGMRVTRAEVLRLAAFEGTAVLETEGGKGR